jgi:hypothetical protein
MQTHRNPHVTVPNESQNSNFEAGTALENLRAEVVQIEALARAAEAAADSCQPLPRISSAWPSAACKRSPPRPRSKPVRRCGSLTRRWRH